MGNFSRNTFDINKNKHYVNVRLQQAVPIVDADWNEMDDIRKHELQDFLRTFIGNGVPNNDDFRIVPVENEINDFLIKKGHCLVSGWVVNNENDIKYSDQQLTKNLSLKAPKNNSRIDTVYLDVWEKEVNSTDDPSLVNPAIGMETCVRIKREWVVRVAEGIEGSGKAASFFYEPDHFYYILANLTRRPNEEIISYGNIIDKRFSGINLEEISRLVQSLYSPTSRIHKVPLLQQTLFGRTVPAATLVVGKNPSGIAFDGTHIWVANYGSNNVSKININTNEVEASIPVGYGPSGIAFDGTYIWVSHILSNFISKIDITRNAAVASILVGNNTRGIAFDGTHIWAVHNGSNNISKVNTNNHGVTIVQLQDPGDIAFDGTHIWVTHDHIDRISKIKITSDVMEASIPVGRDPRCIAFDVTHIWVANYGSNNVSKIDITNNEMVASVPVGNGPIGVAFDGNYIWVANCGSNNVNKIDINSNEVVAYIQVGDCPTGLAFDGTHMWVTNNRGDNVVKIIT